MPPFSWSKREAVLAPLPPINVGDRIIACACNDNDVMSLPSSTTDLWQGLIAQELVFACECARLEEQVVRPECNARVRRKQLVQWPSLVLSGVIGLRKKPRFGEL